MRVKVQVQLVSNLNPQLYKKLADATFRSEGEMRYYLRYGRQYAHLKYKAYYIVDGSEVAAWALTTDEEAQFYVKMKYRQRGYGSALAKKIGKYRRNSLYVCRHDDLSESFFDSLDARKQKGFVL